MRYYIDAYGQRFYGATKQCALKAVEDYENDPGFVGPFQTMLEIKEDEAPVS